MGENIWDKYIEAREQRSKPTEVGESYWTFLLCKLMKAGGSLRQCMDACGSGWGSVESHEGSRNLMKLV